MITYQFKMKQSSSATDSMAPVNVVHNGVKMETRSPNQNTCITEIPRESSLSSVRKLPKKRKYDLSELEETPPRTETTVTTSIQNQIAPPPQSAAVDYSCVAVKIQPKYENPHIYYSETNTNRNTTDYYKPNVNFSVPSISVNNATLDRREPADKFNVALCEWEGDRVLAKRGHVYLPGTIRRADSSAGNVWVEFDGSPEGEILFPDVLQTGRYNIISDASPSQSLINVGTSVCVRTNGSLDDNQMVSRIFVEGVVSKILLSPVKFVVRLSDPEAKEYVVKRADIRLLQPPWMDELENDLDNDQPPPLLPYGNISATSINGNNLSVASSSSYQPSTSTPYCKSAATSPLQVNATPLQTSSVPMPTNSEEQRRRPNDDLCESDDDLRRENISFPSFDGGKPISGFIQGA